MQTKQESVDQADAPEEPRIVTFDLPPLPQEVWDFLDRVDRHEKESRGVSIMVGGPTCGGCNPELAQL